jgi:hypothetical protein
MSPHYFFEQSPPSSTPRSRIDTKLYSVVPITELFPMARSEIILLKFQQLSPSIYEDVNNFISPPYWKNPQMVNIVSDIKTHALSNGKVKFPCSLIIFSSQLGPKKIVNMILYI